MDTAQNDLEAIRKILSELTARVYRIEHKLGIEPEFVERARAAVAAIPAPLKSNAITALSEKTEPPPPEWIPKRVQIPSPREPETDLESRIGSHWLNRIGIAAVLIGVSYFLKFAFDNNWIGPAGRVTIGLVAGVGVVAWSERFRAKGYSAFSYSLKAVGIGALYLSLWAAFQVYSLIPSSAAFVMMLVVTSATAAMA